MTISPHEELDYMAVWACGVFELQRLQKQMQQYCWWRATGKVIFGFFNFWHRSTELSISDRKRQKKK